MLFIKQFYLVIESNGNFVPVSRFDNMCAAPCLCFSGNRLPELRINNGNFVENAKYTIGMRFDLWLCAFT